MRQGASPFVHDRDSALAGRTILQIVPELNAGGAERTAIDIAAALVRAGARALIASEGGRLVSELQANGGLWIPFPAKSKNPLVMLLNAQRLRRLIRAEKADIVHARSRAPAWVAFAATRGGAVPFVTTYHGAYSGGSKLKTEYNSVMARGDAVIANSDYTAGLIHARYPQADNRVRVIHRGTDFAAYSPAAVDPARVQRLRREWNAAPEDRIVLLAARLTGWKGQRVLIEAARILKAQGLSGVKFILAGDAQGRGGYVKELDALCAKAGVADIVRRVGHCADMPAAFLAASVVTVPSTEPEAFGRSAVEAQALGTPVVVSDLGAGPETVLAPPQTEGPRRTGWRVPPGDAGALAAAVAEALAMGASARDAMAARARAHVTEKFSLEKMCAQTLEVYQSVLESDVAKLRART